MTQDRTRNQRQKVARRKSPVRQRQRADLSLSLPGLDRMAAVGQARPVRWVGAGLLWGLAAFGLLALLSFHPNDPNPDRAASVDAIHNLGGVVGAWLGGFLLRAFGLAAYMVPLVVATLGGDIIVRQRRTPLALRLPALILLLFGSAAATALVVPEMRIQTLPAAGWIGQELGDGLIRRYLGIGGLVLLLPILAAAVVGSVGMRAIEWLQQGMAALFAGAAGGAQGLLVSLRSFLRHMASRRRREAPAEPTEGATAAKAPRKLTPRFAIPEEEAHPEPDPAQRSSSSGDRTEPELEIDRPRTVEPAQLAVQRTLVDDGSDPWRRPDLDLLQAAPPSRMDVDEKTLRARAQILEHKVREFGVEGHVSMVRPGPVISVYEFKPAPGVKVAKIANLEDDLALAMEAVSVRIVAPIPGRDVVGIELPNRDRESVALRSILESAAFWDKNKLLPIALGKDTAGEPVCADLAGMPHALVAGATGAGKSVGINGIIVSLLYKHSPRDLRLYLIDPKRLELNFYQGIPHLEGHDVVTDPHEALALLEALVREMEERYNWMAHARVRQIQTYNRAVAQGKVEPRDGVEARHMPFLVCIIDELADLMMVTKKAIEEPIARLAQMARAAGIHLILATQRPSVDVITGLIKANFPTRIAFKVSSRADARVVLDQQGAENLLGKGDMLFKPPTSDAGIRVHGAFVSEEEVARVAEFWKQEAERIGTPSASVGSDAIQEALDRIRGGGASGGGGDGGDIDDELFERAVDMAAQEGVVSTSRIQRHLGIGYNRAARLMDALEARGMVGPQEGAGKPRRFLGRET